MEVVKKYKKGDLTVFWKPDQCIHSTRCWKGLVSVFNPRAKPWVNMDAADADRIMEQVSMCPSGALSYTLEKSEGGVETTETAMTTAIEALRNGPLLVYGDLKVKNSDGSETSKNNVTAFCRCGASASKPYCDGSHRHIGFSDE